MPQASHSSPRRDLVRLLLGCAALWGWSCGLWDLWGPDETRYVQIAREALANGQWLLLTENGAPYDQKPPPAFWMLAAMVWAGGGAVVNWAVRLPSVLFATLTVVLTYDLGRRRLGRRAGWVAAWMTMTAPLLLAEAPSARLDVFMTGFSALAFWGWLARKPGDPLAPSRVALHWMGLIGAFFVKGPVVLVIVWGVIVFEAWRARSWRAIAELKPWWGVAALVVLVGAWLAYQRAVAPPGFMEEQIESATWERIFNPDLHHQPPGFYLGVVFGDGFAPWSLFAAAAYWALWRGRRAPSGDEAALRPILAWAIGSFLFFSILPGKREQYLLPLLPAFALAAGWLVAARLWERPVAAWVRRVMAGLAGLGAIVFFGATALAAMRHPLLARIEFEPTWGRTLVLAAAGALMIGLALHCLRPARWPHAVAAWVAGMAIGSLAVYGAILPGLNGSKSTRALAEAADAAMALGGSGAEAESRVAVVGAMGRTYRPEYQVYGHYMMIELPDKAGALREWLQGNALPAVILGETRDFEDTAEVLAAFDYRIIYESGDNLGPIQVRARGGE